MSAAAFNPTIDFLTAHGFDIVLISPADDPAEAVVSHQGGFAIRVIRDPPEPIAPPTIRILLDERDLAEAGPTKTAPNGIRLTYAPAAVRLVTPPTSIAHLLVTRPPGEEEEAPAGRAGMLYRDLVPDRLGGALIASRILIPHAGPVPDYVHHHLVRFQMIFCRKGWVRVVYEGQGPEFVLEEGDCVLQPSGIRHRVLESSEGMEVVELSAPAVHATFGDPTTNLPSDGPVDKERTWGGQRFVRFVDREAAWIESAEVLGLEVKDSGVGDASGGVVGLRVVRAKEQAKALVSHVGEMVFLFVLDGRVSLGAELVGASGCFVVPPAKEYAMEIEAGTRLLEVTVPAGLSYAKATHEGPSR
ncbi:hypothetical protein HK101_003906 [Irineochytrium annulatum]|nr:hypothetical protein HK101_003906 [Irineochytrium annulatum]